jgi:hypothetical protein
MPYAAPENVPFTTNFIDVPNAVQSEISHQHVGFKMLTKTFFPSSYCHHILGGDFATKHELTRRARLTYGASTVIGAGKYVSKN